MCREYSHFVAWSMEIVFFLNKNNLKFSDISDTIKAGSDNDGYTLFRFFFIIIINIIILQIKAENNKKQNYNVAFNVKI